LNLRALVPFRDRQSLARSDVNVFGSLQREVDRLFDEFAHSLSTLAVLGNGNLATLMPNMDIDETEKEFVITAELPGLERKDVEISLENNMLTIRGEKKMETSPDDKKTRTRMSMSASVAMASSIECWSFRSPLIRHPCRRPCQRAS
jgi:HSP20 family protein